VLEFALPLAFLLLPLPWLVLRLAPPFRDQGEALRAPFFRRVVDLTGRAPQPGAVVVRKGVLQRVVLVAVWGLLVVALAAPEWAGTPIVREIAARDLLLAVDLSGSMETADFRDAQGKTVTRLAAAQAVLDDFIRRRQGDRLGLVVFGSAAFLQAPFTEDHATVRALLDELEPRMAGPRTMIGDAIGLGVRLFEGGDRESRVMVLLTDGNDTGSQLPVKRAAKIAAEHGITIHTVAMGDPTTVGEEALDEATLREIAKATGGRSFLALDHSELDAIYAEIDRIEPELRESLAYHPRRSLFQWPVGAAVLLVTLLSAWMIRPGRPAHA